MAQLTLQQLRAFGIRPDTSLGQHFLIDNNVLDVISRLSKLAPDDVCYEPGVGVGVLTDHLARNCKHVHGVEIDRRLEPAIDAMQHDLDNVTMHWGDAMDISVSELDPQPNKLVSNLPYHVSTPIVAEALQHQPGIRSYCVMVQREVADRFFASHGNKQYGAVSALIGATCDRTGIHKVSRSVFAPPPNVDSSLVAFERHDKLLATTEVHEFSQFLKTSFRHRRKTLANNLQTGDIAPREVTVELLAEVDHKPAARPEQLSPQQFVQVFHSISKIAQ